MSTTIRGYRTLLNFDSSIHLMWLVRFSWLQLFTLKSVHHPKYHSNYPENVIQRDSFVVWTKCTLNWIQLLPLVSLTAKLSNSAEYILSEMIQFNSSKVWNCCFDLQTSRVVCSLVHTCSHYSIFNGTLIVY